MTIPRETEKKKCSQRRLNETPSFDHHELLFIWGRPHGTFFWGCDLNPFKVPLQLRQERFKAVRHTHAGHQHGGGRFQDGDGLDQGSVVVEARNHLFQLGSSVVEIVKKARHKHCSLKYMYEQPVASSPNQRQ